MYGWNRWPGPSPFQNEEQVADMKLICDAVFANGINKIIWHGMPFNAENRNNRFYASVHVGPDSHFAEELPSFNKYMDKVSSYMKQGKPYSDIAVYLPIEDAWTDPYLPYEKQYKWAWGNYEMRYTKMPDVLKGYQPLWINKEFIAAGKLLNNKLVIGNVIFNSIYIDVNFLDYDGLISILRLAENEFPVFMISIPKEPGFNKHQDYNKILKTLMSLPNVKSEFSPKHYSKPLVEGIELTSFWSKKVDSECYIFFSNPNAEDIKYPLSYGQSFSIDTIIKDVIINYHDFIIPVTLVFEPYQSILMRVFADGRFEMEDISFIPKTPEVKTLENWVDPAKVR